MSASATCSRQSVFFVCLSQSKKSTLLLDYDGTLAPFRPDRQRAVPYPWVPDLLESIGRGERSRVVVISGRSAREIPPLLGMRVSPEIWGSHGMERLLPDGDYKVVTLHSSVTTAFANAAESLDREGLGRHMEMKPGSLAVHWRGLPREIVAEVWTVALRVLQPIAFSAGLILSNFDGGVEMRVRTPNKSDAVNAIVRESGDHCPSAYLGDDVTDEDAFKALNPRGLTVLVRNEYRPTSAEIWLRPPSELQEFLEQWRHAVGGDV